MTREADGERWGNGMDLCVGSPSHCSFEVLTVEPEAVTICDLDLGGRSVTNDAKYAVEQLRAVELLVPGQRLYYFDSTGNLDEIVWEQGEISFRPGPERIHP